MSLVNVHIYVFSVWILIFICIELTFEMHKRGIWFFLLNIKDAFPMRSAYNYPHLSHSYIQVYACIYSTIAFTSICVCVSFPFTQYRSNHVTENDIGKYTIKWHLLALKAEPRTWLCARVSEKKRFFSICSYTLFMNLTSHSAFQCTFTSYSLANYAILFALMNFYYFHYFIFACLLLNPPLRIDNYETHNTFIKMAEKNSYRIVLLCIVLFSFCIVSFCLWRNEKFDFV